MRRASQKFRESGFTLVEVLVALAMAAIGFAVVLHSVGLQLMVVSRSVDRHQMLMYGSQILETNLSEGLGEEEIEEQELIEEEDADSDSEDQRGQMVKASRYLYSVSMNPVTADPRVQQVSVVVRDGRSSLRLSAYRLRIQREP